MNFYVLSSSLQSQVVETHVHRTSVQGMIWGLLVKCAKPCHHDLCRFRVRTLFVSIEKGFELLDESFFPLYGKGEGFFEWDKICSVDSWHGLWGWSVEESGELCVQLLMVKMVLDFFLV